MDVDTVGVNSPVDAAARDGESLRQIEDPERALAFCVGREG